MNDRHPDAKSSGYRIRLTDLFHFAEQENIPELHKFYSKTLKERPRKDGES